MRILGLDYGAKTVGVAVSDPLLLTAQPLETIGRSSENKLRATVRRIGELITEYGVSEIVLGLPVMMSGEKGERAKLTESFAEMLEKRTGLPVHLVDERLTTVEADEILYESGVPAGERKKVIDRIAAGLILQDYLNGLSDSTKKALTGAGHTETGMNDGREDCI